jgi:6-phosphogluconolactonase
MRYLAIDHGQKRIGLAVSDAGGSMAFPHSVIEAGPHLIPQIVRAIGDERIEAIVVGLPLNMDGTEGPSAAAARKFAEAISARVSQPIVFFDERLSSAEADWKLAGAGMSRQKKKKLQDAVAAASFLQTFLDEKKEAEKTNSISAPQIIRLETPQLVAQNAMDIFSACFHQAIDQRGVFFCAVSGGDSPVEFFKLLATDRSLDWVKIHLFWADERGVGPEHPDSNFYLAKNTFLSEISIPADNIHRIPAERTDMRIAAAEYEQTLQKVFSLSPGQVPAFDLIVLGLGADGHTASLAVDADMADIQQGLVAAVLSSSLPYPRITLTVPTLCAARKLMFLITGLRKAQMVHHVLCESSDRERPPVRLLWPSRQKMVWLLDADAASLLP